MTELTPEEWETGLLKILAKKGDLTLPGNYGGIMLLETSYKIVATVLNKRLQLIDLSRIVVIEIFSFFSSKTDFIFEFLVKTYVYAGNFSLIQ